MKAMQCFGMTREDASMYTCGGCMEIAPQGMNSDLLFSGFHNVPKTVEMVLTGGECLRTGQRLGSVSLPALPDYATFDELYDAFSAELERELNGMFRRLDLYSAAMAERRPVFLLSCMTEDCLKRGRELHDGGARYHDYGIGPLGIPNAGDALFSVKRAVFEDRICSASELLSALRSDFSGHEELRLRLRSLPKYGQQDAEADEMTDRVLKTVCTIFREHRNRWDGMVKPVVLTFVWGPVAGAALGATADGNHAGTPIAQSLTPQSYAMSHGITAAIGSHAALSLDLVSGGASSMWDISPEWATTETVGTILRTFIELGGHIFQGNTTDVAELIRAREHPEDHPGLMVRVGGFSARFVTLDEALQKEIITRRRHSS
jgi:formate C-acetyltransferase